LDCDNCNCDNTWGGVEVHGQRYLPQLEQNQGRLIGRPGSIIENADIGIYVASFEPANLGETSYSGGIVNCLGTELRNGEIAEKSNKISLFPNPAKEFITIQNSSENRQKSSKERFRIINSEGKIIKEFLFSSGESRTIETADFKSGLYFYQLFLSEQTFETGKFLIQH
jgi:hypothetical protein